MPSWRISKEAEFSMPSRTALLLTAARAWPWWELAVKASRQTGAAQKLQLRRVAQGLLDALQVKLEVQGLQEFPSEPSIIVVLHESLLDPVVLLAALPAQLRFVMRDEFMGWQGLGALLQRFDVIPICPEQPASSLRTLLRSTIKPDEHLVIFPQGSVLGLEIALKSGAFLAAQKLGRAIVPIALTGTHRIWEHPFSARLRIGERVSLRVLEPISAASVATTEPRVLLAEVQRRLKIAALEPTMVAPRRYIPSRDGYWLGYSFDVDDAFPALQRDLNLRRTQWNLEREGAALADARALSPNAPSVRFDDAFDDQQT
jgi:1-acyl-sn-glycerol-3-phosphate acyltransferase